METTLIDDDFDSEIDEGLMTKKQILKALRTCKKVFATVHLTVDDTYPIQVIKSDLAFNLHNFADVEKWSKGKKGLYFKAFVDKTNDLILG